MSNTLIIRADANTHMGTGHVMRCIALSQAWQDAGGNVIFATCCDNTTLLQRLHDENFQVIQLSDSNEFLARLSSDITPEKTSGLWVILDGYHFDLEYQQAIRSAGFKLLYIDDYNHLPEYEVDILLNQNIGAQELNYHCNSECRKLMGTRYIMLRREFRSFEKQKNSISTKRTNILITMGGSDPDNATLPVIQALSEINQPDIQIKIIVGPSNPHIQSLKDAIKHSTLNCQILPMVKDMPHLIKWADFAITAAGSTCWELAALEVPFITVVLAKNQERVAQKLATAGIALCAGTVSSNVKKQLLACCRDIFDKKNDSIAKKKEKLSNLLDCFGTDRILSQPAAQRSLDLYKDRLVLRRTSMDDALTLLLWANDPSTRQNSFNSEQIKQNHHLDWLIKKLNSKKTLMFIMELDKVPCGHIRFDFETSKMLLLSYVIAPEFRGMRLGKSLVELGLKEIITNKSNYCVKAITFAENTASAKIFQKTGFNCNAQEIIKDKLCNVYLWNHTK